MQNLRRATMLCAIATFTLVGAGWRATQPPQRPPLQPAQRPPIHTPPQRPAQPQARPAVPAQQRPANRPQVPTLQLKPEASLYAQVVTGPDKQIEWLSVVRLEAPESLTLRWKTDRDEDAAAGRWQLLKLGTAEPLTTGVITTLPKPGQPYDFDVDLRKYLPATPPDAPALYIIDAWPTKVSLPPGQKKPTYPQAGPKSNPVVIAYSKSKAAPVHFEDFPTPAPRYRVFFEWMQCLEETDEAGDDEPYLVVYAADLSKLGSPDFATVSGSGVYGPYDGDNSIEKGEKTAGGSNPVWLPRMNKDEEIRNPEDILILVCLMENDDGTRPSEWEIDSNVTYSLLLELGVGLPRDIQIEAAKTSLKGAISNAADLGNVDNADEQIGPIQILRLTQADLDAAANGWHFKYLDFKGDGGHYKVAFSMRRSG